MNPKVKEDIVSVLKKIIDILKTKESADYIEMSAVSNEVIHNAGIFQDEDSLSIAVLVYAASKMIKRCIERELPYPDFIPILEKAKDFLEHNNIMLYRDAIKSAFAMIQKCDSKFRLYIEEVVHQARIKKGEKLCEHGISAARAAELLGVSQWSMMGYIGQTVTADAEMERADVEKRLKKARELFR